MQLPAPYLGRNTGSGAGARQINSSTYCLSSVVRTGRINLSNIKRRTRLLTFNDLFIGSSSHVSARYKISFNNRTEEQSSSGVIISTQAGSTGWLSSIFNMAYDAVGMFDKNLKLKRPKLKDSDLLFAVREAFQSVKTQIGLTTGILKAQSNLTIESLMPSSGVISSDGIESDFLKFNSGAIVKIGLANETVTLITNEPTKTLHN